MMGRVTFHDPAVIDRVQSNFVATWTNAQPGYRVGRIDAATFEHFSHEKAKDHDGDFAPDLAATLPNGQANENVATIVANARGEVIHVIPGFWHTEPYLAELAFAGEVSRAVEAAGDDSAARHNAAAAKYGERMKRLGHEAGDLGRAVLGNALSKLAADPLREVASIDGVEEFAFHPDHVLRPKMERLQRAIAQAQHDGKDLSRVAEAMKDFESLMKQMRVTEAEAAIDRALEAIGEKE